MARPLASRVGIEPLGSCVRPEVEHALMKSKETSHRLIIEFSLSIWNHSHKLPLPLVATFSDTATQLGCSLSANRKCWQAVSILAVRWDHSKPAGLHPQVCSAGSGSGRLR